MHCKKYPVNEHVMSLWLVIPHSDVSFHRYSSVQQAAVCAALVVWLQQLYTAPRARSTENLWAHIWSESTVIDHSSLSSNNQLVSFSSTTTLHSTYNTCWRSPQGACASWLRHEARYQIGLVENRVKLQAFVYFNYDSQMSKQATEVCWWNDWVSASDRRMLAACRYHLLSVVFVLNDCDVFVQRARLTFLAY